jgi:predicted MFS family arabinose efflux permease
MILCLCVFLTYIPDAGQVSFLFLYLKAIIGFTEEKVALFIAICGVMSILSQTVLLTTLQQTSTKLTSIMIGLAFQSLNLFLFAFGKSDTIMWTAGAFYAISTITFPAITSLVSSNADEDKQVKKNVRFFITFKVFISHCLVLFWRLFWFLFKSVSELGLVSWFDATKHRSNTAKG